MEDDSSGGDCSAGFKETDSNADRGSACTRGECISQQQQQQRVSVVVDLGFPWPNEAGPAKERKTAVVKQLGNFVRDVLEPHTAAAAATASSSSSTPTTFYCRSTPLSFPLVRCCGVGVVDVAARLAPLSPWVNVQSEDFFSRNSNGGESSTPKQPSTSSSSAVILYLSPDAEAVLDTRWGFPKNAASGFGSGGGSGSGGQSVTLVVGGLVDRKVKRGRSKARATAIATQQRRRRPKEAPAEPVDGDGDDGDNNSDGVVGGGGSVDGEYDEMECGRGRGEQVIAVQLPLGDDCGAPLNIDTVLAMLFYWQHFSDNEFVDQGVISPSSASSSWALPIEALGGDAKDAPVGEAFAAAYHRAMAEHKLRHPNQGRHIL